MTDSSNLLVPVDQSRTIRQTVAYAIETATELAESGTDVTVHFVSPVFWRAPESARREEAESFLEQVAVWCREDLGLDADEAPEAEHPVTVETAVIGEGVYLFSPADYVDVILDYAGTHGVQRIVLDPEYAPAGSTPLIESFAVELRRGPHDVEQAPVERPTRRTRVTTEMLPGKFIATFAISFGFYLLLGDPFYWFDLATGAATAAVTAALLSQVTFVYEPNFRRTLRQLLRMAVYGPYLLKEIVVANVQMAYVILHPTLPIDPEVIEYDAAVWGSLPTTTLANSITLTPGTLTIEVVQDRFHVHSLVPSTKDDLLDGGLERAVRFVFYGRSAARIPSPRERRPDEGED
jgi:multicomponent Na+:H+ antiporter subunit E